MLKTLPRIALTIGEPSGIGPDIALQLAQHEIPAHIVIFADPDLLSQRAKLLNLSVQFDVREKHFATPHETGLLKVSPVPLAAPVECGKLNPANAGFVLNALNRACRACQTGEFDALVTAPIHKGIINRAGIGFSGHTEFLAQQTGASQVVMMLMTPDMRIALATTHLPLSLVSAAITPHHLETVIRILHTDLKQKFAISNPTILVCGLNPHAGEDGFLGHEEVQTIIPVMEKLRQEGMKLIGPIPADTAFIPERLRKVDVILSMYHDQGLPVLKYHGFGRAVNVTLGLPIIRTSVDHGTALELAGTGHARGESLQWAVQIALETVTRRHLCLSLNQRAFSY